MPARCICCQCPGDHPKLTTLTCLFSSCFAHRWFWGTWFLCLCNDNIDSFACRACWTAFYVIAFPVNLFLAFAGFALGLMIDAIMFLFWFLTFAYCCVCTKGPKTFIRDRTNCWCACPRCRGASALTHYRSAREQSRATTTIAIATAVAVRLRDRLGFTPPHPVQTVTDATATVTVVTEIVISIVNHSGAIASRHALHAARKNASARAVDAQIKSLVALDRGTIPRDALLVGL